MSAPDPTIERQEQDKVATAKAATAKILAAQIEAMRSLTESINRKALAPAPVLPARRVKTKPKRRRKS